MATLVLNANTASALSITCQRAGRAVPRRVGSKTYSFAGAERSSVRGQAKVIPITTSYVDTPTEALIQNAGYNGAALPCSGDILGNIQTVCSFENVVSNMMPGLPGFFEMAFTLNEVQASVVLLKYSPGDTITGDAFTRSTTASQVSATGVLSFAAINTKRDAHYINGAGPYTLVEDTSANLCLQAENFGTTWNTTGFGTPTRVAASDTASGVTLDTLGDDDAAGLEGYAQTIAFTGNGGKGISFHIKKGTATSSAIRLRAIGLADRMLAIVTWTGAVPTVTMVGAGTLLGIDTLFGGVYRVRIECSTGLLAANTNDIQVFPATDSGLSNTQTGTILIGGVQAENLTFCTSYIKTTTATVTRGAELWSLPYTTPPGETTFFMKFVEMGTLATALASPLQICNVGGAAPRYMIYGSTFYVSNHNNGAGGVESVLATAPVAGDAVELAARLFGDGSTDITQSINGANATSGTQSPVNAFATAWSSVTAWPNSTGAGGFPHGFMALQSLKIVAGARSLSEMRSA